MVRSAAVVAFVVAGTVFIRAGQDLTRDESRRMAQKIDAMTARGILPPSRLGPPVQTSFTDREINAYFQFDGRDRLPPGVLNPQVTIDGSGRVSAHATVDLDEVRKSQPQGMLGMVLHGSVDVRVAATITTEAGRGTVSVDAVTIGGISVPPSLLQSIVTQYTKTPDMPDGFVIDKPFVLPANIREVRMNRGSATIVQ